MYVIRDWQDRPLTQGHDNQTVAMARAVAWGKWYASKVRVFFLGEPWMIVDPSGDCWMDPRCVKG